MSPEHKSSKDGDNIPLINWEQSDIKQKLHEDQDDQSAEKVKNAVVEILDQQKVEKDV